jgi:beta-glucosidase/6-phospho-beta-glucosidase/beta-galactosidase
MAAILLYLGIKASSSWWSRTSLPSQIPSNSSVITTTTHPQLNITTAVRAAVDISTVVAAPFPPNFVWGVATSSYQIEGATQQDGRGVTIWDTFVRIPGHILDGSTGDTADDHYHWYRQDVALMHSWNVTAYRFSIAWSRILPTGRGPINEAGIRFYDGLIDELLRHNIEPWITLFHWDLPQALQTDYEGWLDRRTVDCYCYYARIVFQHFAHKVKRFITLNEPWT